MMRINGESNDSFGFPTPFRALFGSEEQQMFVNICGLQLPIFDGHFAAVKLQTFSECDRKKDGMFQ